MNTAALKRQLSPQLQRAQAAWAQLAPRERTGVIAAGAALLLLVVVLAFVNPALRALRESPERLRQLDAQLAQMQAWAAEAARLQQQPPVSPAQAAAALEAASQQLGADAKLTVLGDRATLDFSHQEGERLAMWLAEVRSAARAKPVEVQMQRGERGYSGRIVLQLGAPT